jgi:hypothetical protein
MHATWNVRANLKTKQIRQTGGVLSFILIPPKSSNSVVLARCISIAPLPTSHVVFSPASTLSLLTHYTHLMLKGDVK